MPPTSSGSIDAQIERLTDRVAAVEARLALVEQDTGRAAMTVGLVDHAGPPRPAIGPAFEPMGLVTNLGRALIILGGAFLLRAITEAGAWPPLVGVSIGLLYSLTWLVASDRAAAGGNRLRAVFDGGTALMIGYPLIAEAALKFVLLTPTAAALALGGFTTGALLAANHSRVAALAWLASLGGLAAGLVLIARTSVVAPMSFYVTGLGVATLWLGYLRAWRGLRWLTGAAAGVAVLGVTLRAVARPPVDPAALAWASQAFLLVAYLGSIALRTLVRGRQVIVFEIAQTVVVLAVGLGGMVVVGHAVAGGDLLVGGGGLILGAAAYAVSFQFLARHAPAALNFYFYSSLALIFTMVGTWTAVHGPARSMVLVAVGAALALAWSRSSRTTLGAHTAVALAAAAQDSGLGTLGLAAFIGGTAPLGAAQWPALVTLAIVVAVCGSRLTGARGTAPSAADAPGLALGVIAVIGGGGLVTPVVASALSLPAGDLVTTIRTATLSLLAAGCARLARTGPFSVLGHLAYPLLAATGVKLLLVDLRNSRASTLFAALACYGAALVMVPRLRRRKGMR